MKMYSQLKQLVIGGLFIGCASVQAVEYIESYQQLENYVEQCVANMFYPEHNSTPIYQLQRDIIRKINHNYNLGFMFYSYYRQPDVYNAIMDEMVNYVSDLAYKLKGEYARTMIRKEIIDRISRMSEMPTGFFAEYIGRSLQNKLLYIQSSQAQVQPQQQLYPSSECCICMEEFDGSIEQVFLVPCGHDMCKVCCKSHFFDYNNKECPKCRARVDMQRLREVVFASSRPSNQWNGW